MNSSRIGSQLSVQSKRGVGMRAWALLGLGAFLFACGTDNGDPVPSDGNAPSAPASITTPESTTPESSDPASSSPSESGAGSATPGTGEVAPPGMGEATPGVGTELVGVDGMVEGGGSTPPGTGEGTPEAPGVPEGDTVTPSVGCGTTRQLVNGRRTIQSGGVNREYILRVPDDYDNTRPYRLVLAYHWLNGNANQVANGGMGGSTEAPFFGLWDLAENSTIFVAPEGLPSFQGLGWDNPGGRDVTLTDAILEEVLSDLCIDRTRIFATGFSFGASMSHALACARADVFRGVALYAGAQLSGCDGGTTPMAYFHVHGVRDSVLRFEDSGIPLRDRYVALNGCTPQNPPAPAALSGTHICTSYEGCSEGHPVRWCAHGGDHNPTEKDQGQSESWVPGEAWAFISQF